MEGIIVALIGLAGSAIGSIIGVIASARLTSYRLEQLEKRVQAHNKPFPGTDYYKVCKENGWIKGGEYRPTDVQHDSILNLPNISADEMERLLFRNNLSYFLNPSFVWKQMRRFSSWSEFAAALKALRVKLFHK